MAEQFEFGKNWSRFLRTLDPQRIEQAKQSLRAMLGMESLAGKSFLDVGSGSGLFSLAARQLGASVHSFDGDPESVFCTDWLRRRYCPGDQEWTVERASVLDAGYLGRLGRFDVVYAWGVLHHTGDLWRALGNVLALVADGGLLAISIYNDQGRRSRAWRRVKAAYNRLPRPLRAFILPPCAVRLWGPTMLRDLFRLHPLRTWRTYGQERGMSPWHDIVDWVGGYPFEVARPEQVLDFCRNRGFELVKLKTCGGGHGCNEYVFRAVATPARSASAGG
jgi:2-polyprenyl-6-hydroxyphenyl methylase/3-demethylubiquinone-9 3-methyltransferase